LARGPPRLRASVTRVEWILRALRPNSPPPFAIGATKIADGPQIRETERLSERVGPQLRVQCSDEHDEIAGRDSKTLDQRLVGAECRDAPTRRREKPQDLGLGDLVNVG